MWERVLDLRNHERRRMQQHDGAVLQDLPTLLAEASLERHAPALSGETLDSLQQLRLVHGRPALLQRLKELEVAPLPDRQKCVQLLAQASRAGRIPTRLTVREARPGVDYHGKIAFLFLIYDQIHHDDLWAEFFRAADPHRYSIYVHAKTRTAPLSPLFEHCHLPPSAIVPTEYATISLVHAQNRLLQAALHDVENRKFVFVSGACIPIKPFRICCDCLLRDDRALFSEMTDLTGNDRDLQRKIVEAGASHGIGSKQASKASQWCVLNRRLADLCAHHTSSGYIHAFAEVKAPEEWYYLTTARVSMNSSDHYDVDAVPDVHRNHVGPTFVNWREADGEPSRPREYKRATVDDLHTLVQGPSMLARKFAKDCDGLEPLRDMLRREVLMQQASASLNPNLQAGGWMPAPAVRARAQQRQSAGGTVTVRLHKPEVSSRLGVKLVGTGETPQSASARGRTRTIFALPCRC